MADQASIGSSAGPPKGIGPMARREMRLAYAMLLPTFAIVVAVVMGPLLANIWISFKPVQLGDLRPATVFVNERLRGTLDAAGDTAEVEYRVRNSSREDAIAGAALHAIDGDVGVAGVGAVLVERLHHHQPLAGERRVLDRGGDVAQDPAVLHDRAPESWSRSGTWTSSTTPTIAASTGTNQGSSASAASREPTR